MAIFLASLAASGYFNDVMLSCAGLNVMLRFSMISFIVVAGLDLTQASGDLVTLQPKACVSFAQGIVLSTAPPAVTE